MPEAGPRSTCTAAVHRTGHWRVGFEQTNGKNPSDPLFEKFYMIGSNGLAWTGRPLIIATWAGRSSRPIERTQAHRARDRFEGRQFNGPNGRSIRQAPTAPSTSPTPTAACPARERPAQGPRLPGRLHDQDGRVSGSSTISEPERPRLSPTKKFSTRTAAATSTCGATASCPTTRDRQPDVHRHQRRSDSRITDGLKVDVKGNVWNPRRAGVIVSPEGKHLARY